MQESELVLNENTIKVIIKRKGLEIPLMITRPTIRSRFETDQRRLKLASQKGSKANSMDFQINTIVQPLKPVNISTYNFSQTPTPSEDRKNSYFGSSFETHSSSKRTSRNISADARENVKSVYSATRHAINARPWPKNGSQKNVNSHKLTMKDFNLNLPTIIKSKKIKKKCRFKFNFIKV